jgi:cytochrome b6-f complex iron-sulfur subunit
MSDAANPPPTPPAQPAAAPAAAAPAAKPEAPPKPAAPAKPAPAAKPGDDRRGFLRKLGDSVVIGWVSFTAAMIAMTLGTTRFLFPNVLAEPPNKIKVGDPRNFDDGKVVDSFKDRGFWIVRNQGKIYALSTTCTHLGCTPNWLEADKKFKCPCHGSGFYITGINFEGPAPRPLERWGLEISDDGQLVVDKSKKFQYELGQWDNKDSFFEV